MAENDINRWHDTITPREKAPQPWSIGSGGSWDMLDVQPIPDEMLAELMQRYQYSGTPWNCRSLPLSPNDREYMFLLFYSMQGLVARMRAAEKRADAAALSTPPAVPSNFVLIPKELTAENGAKAALIGEFAEVTAALCPDCQGNYDDCFTCNGDGTVSQHVPIKWDTIKRIYRKAVEVCALSAAPAASDAKNG